MILEIFMPIYNIKCYKNNIIEGSFNLSIKTDTIEEAAVGILGEFAILGITDKYNNNDWNAKIINPKGKDYKILEKGKLLINLKTGRLKTGKKVNSLEKKLG